MLKWWDTHEAVYEAWPSLAVAIPENEATHWRLSSKCKIIRGLRAEQSQQDAAHPSCDAVVVVVVVVVFVVVLVFVAVVSRLKTVPKLNSTRHGASNADAFRGHRLATYAFSRKKYSYYVEMSVLNEKQISRGFSQIYYDLAILHAEFQSTALEAAQLNAWQHIAPFVGWPSL